MTGAAAGGGIDDQQRMTALVIELAQGKTALLPEGLLVEIGRIAGDCVLGLSHLQRLDIVPAHGHGQVVVTEPALGS